MLERGAGEEPYFYVSTLLEILVVARNYAINLEYEWNGFQPFLRFWVGHCPLRSAGAIEKRVSTLLEILV